MTFEKCVGCGRQVSRGRNGITQRTCGAEECKRFYDRERKRLSRAKARGEVPESAPAPVPSDGGFVTPWGVYGSEVEAWADCLMTGGNGSEYVSQEEQYRRAAMLRELVGRNA